MKTAMWVLVVLAAVVAGVWLVGYVRAEMRWRQVPRARRERMRW